MAFYVSVPRRLAVISAVLFVLTAYAYFGSYGTFSFHSRDWAKPGGRPGDAYYASLAEGFRRGELSLAHRPDPQLMAMPHPYDYEARHRDNVPYLWDASYFNGRYYLYFTPLPVLFVYLPHYAVYGGYPSDQFAAAVFAAWAFLMASLFVAGALGKERNIPLPIWLLLIGLGNVVPFIMVFSRTYEVATLCGMAMTATWAWSLLRYLQSPRTSRLVWMAVWLGLAIAARPNLALLLPIAFLALPKPRLEPALIAAIPLGAIAIALMSYNYARFHDPFEFGVRYQLTYVPMGDFRVCGCTSPAEALRVVNNASVYVFAPVQVRSDFPFADLPVQRLDPAVSFNGYSEEVGGLAPLLPLAALGSLAAALLVLRREPLDTSARAAMLVLAGGWLVLLGLSSCWYVTARYENDFMMLIAAGSAVIVDRTLTTRPLRAIAIVLAIYSVLLGTLLGFKGTGGWFAKENPKLFKRLSDMF